jgi:hypothetical protein
MSEDKKKGKANPLPSVKGLPPASKSRQPLPAHSQETQKSLKKQNFTTSEKVRSTILKIIHTFSAKRK